MNVISLKINPNESFFKIAPFSLSLFTIFSLWSLSSNCSDEFADDLTIRLRPTTVVGTPIKIPVATKSPTIQSASVKEAREELPSPQNSPPENSLGFNLNIKNQSSSVSPSYIAVTSSDIFKRGLCENAGQRMVNETAKSTLQQLSLEIQKTVFDSEDHLSSLISQYECLTDLSENDDLMSLIRTLNKGIQFQGIRLYKGAISVEGEENKIKIPVVIDHSIVKPGNIVNAKILSMAMGNFQVLRRSYRADIILTTENELPESDVSSYEGSVNHESTQIVSAQLVNISESPIAEKDIDINLPNLARLGMKAAALATHDENIQVLDENSANWQNGLYNLILSIVMPTQKSAPIATQNMEQIIDDLSKTKIKSLILRRDQNLLDKGSARSLQKAITAVNGYEQSVLESVDGAFPLSSSWEIYGATL